MKPKTNLQKEIVKLSKTLPPLSNTFKKFAKSKMQNCFVSHYKSNYCLECNSKFEDKDFKDNICPNCGKHLESANRFYNGFINEKTYFEIHTTRGNYQVIRMILLEKYSTKYKKPGYTFREVMQHWIREDGENETLSLPVVGMSGFLDAWTRGGELEIRTHSQKWGRRRDIAGMIYPNRRKYLPVILRNGYDPNNHSFYSGNVFVFGYLINRSEFETMLKAKQYRLYDYLIDKAYLLKDYWRQIKIAIRHNYIVNEPTTWIDHIRVLEQLNLDINNPFYLLPINLEKEHTKLNTRLNKRIAKESRKKFLENVHNDSDRYIKEKKKLLDIKIKSDNILIRPLQSVEEFLDIGTEQHHCIFSSKYYNKKNSLILTAIVGEKHTETIEYSLKDRKILQARGIFNEPSKYHSSIVDLINKKLNNQLKKLKA